MIERTNAEYIALLRGPNTLDIVRQGIADRLTELDAEVNHWVAMSNADWKRWDALRPPCSTCDGEKFHIGGMAGDKTICPDCVDGKVSIEQLAATWRAVWDDQPYDGDLPTEIAYLRAVRP